MRPHVLEQPTEKSPPLIASRNEEQTFNVHFPARKKCPYTGRVSDQTLHYSVMRRRRLDGSEWSGWSWQVFSLTMRERRWCDPDKPTFKRVVKATKELLGEAA